MSTPHYPPLTEEAAMREWLVIESARNKAVFAPDSGYPPGYIPRDVAEKLLGRDLGGRVWFRKDESDKMRAHPDWRDTEPGWSPLGFWS